MAYHGRGLVCFLVVEAEKLFIRSSGSLRSVVATVEREREAVSLTHILVRMGARGVRWKCKSKVASEPATVMCLLADCRGLSRFAGRKLPLNEEVYACASQTNFRNQSIARLLQSYGRDLF